MLPRIVGHRGAAAVAPENTLAGFRAAAEAGAAWVEFDVRLAGDGTTVVIHDATVDRTTDGRGAVSSLDAAALARLDAGSGFGGRFAGERLPTLAETLRECARLGLGVNIELKPDPGRVRQLAEAVAADLAALGTGAPAPVLLSSFSRAALEACAAVMPDRPRGYLAEELPERWLSDVLELGCLSVHLEAEALTAAGVKAVKAAGYLLAVYTVNDVAAASRLIGWGVDTIITDDPRAMAPLQTGEAMH